MDTNLTNVGYVEEVTPGTTPTANLQLFRRTGGSMTPSTGTTRSAEIRASLRPGEVIRTGQMTRGSYDLEWSYGTLDDFLEGMFMESWSSNVLVDGTTKKSYTVEEQFTDPSISPSIYMAHKLCRVESLSMRLALGSVVTGSLGLMGAVPTATATSAGTGNTAATSSEVFNAVDMVTQIQENSSDLGHLIGLDLNFSRSLREKGELGSLNPWEIGVGRFTISGQLQQYFEDDRLIDKYLAFTQTDLDFTLTNAASQAYQIELPKIRFVGDPEIRNGGVDTDRILVLNFEAEATDSDSFYARITRTP